MLCRFNTITVIVIIIIIINYDITYQAYKSY